MLVLLFFASAAAAQSEGTMLPGLPVARHAIHDGRGREIIYYSNRPSRPAPILLMIQGSGCDRILHLGERGNYSTLYDFLPFAQEGRFVVVAVEKPFSGPDGGTTPGTALGCSPAFNADFSADSWLATLQAVLADVRRQPFVDTSRTLILGVSEGAVMASLLAGADSRVTDVAAISGSGTTQLFDFIAFAYQRCFDRSACLAEIERQVAAIRAAPDSSTDFAWGHPYRRWTSFFRADPAEALLRSHARIYLGIGTADASVPPLSQEVMVARLLAAGRDLSIRRVAEAGHGLVAPGTGDFSTIDAELRRVLDWFGNAPRH